MQQIKIEKRRKFSDRNIFKKLERTWEDRKSQRRLKELERKIIKYSKNAKIILVSVLDLNELYQETITHFYDINKSQLGYSAVLSIMRHTFSNYDELRKEMAKLCNERTVIAENQAVAILRERVDETISLKFREEIWTIVRRLKETS